MRGRAAEPLDHVVIVPSTGRPAVLGETVAALARQTVPADLVVVSVPEPDDVDPVTAHDPRVLVVRSQRGSSVQRNTALRALEATPRLVTYLDDDIELRSDYFERARAFLTAHPDVVLLTGLVVLDGIDTGEVDRAVARDAAARAAGSELVRDVRAAYGCNMTVRGDVAARVGFDERMRLYAWQEDTDFSVRAGRLGRVVHYHGCVGAHMAVGAGRVNGRVLGFAQVVNPFYLWRKGSKTGPELVRDLTHYLAANTVNVVLRRLPARPDRAGRLTGNLLGLVEIVAHGGRPEAVEAVARPGRRV